MLFAWNEKDLSQWRTELPNGHADEAMSVGEVADKKAIRVYYPLSWGKDQNGKFRAEMKAPNGQFLQNGKEYRLFWTTHMANNENNRNLIAMDKPNCSHCQWHNMDVTGTSQIHYRAGNYVGNFGTYSSGNLGRINLGAFDRFEMHFKVSTGNDGFCKIWCNQSHTEEPVYSRKGQNLKTGDSRFNLKFGVYCGANEWVNVVYREQWYADFVLVEVA